MEAMEGTTCFSRFIKTAIIRHMHMLLCFLRPSNQALVSMEWIAKPSENQIAFASAKLIYLIGEGIPQ